MPESRVGHCKDFVYFRVENKDGYGWIIQCCPAVVIVPIRTNGSKPLRGSGLERNDQLYLGLIEIFRSPVESVGWEFPGGAIKPHENPEMAARRELEEETATTTDDVKTIGRFYEAPGKMSFLHEVILAWNPRGLPDNHGKIIRKEEGIRSFHYFDLRELDKMMRTGSICAGPTLSALALLRNWFNARIDSTRD